MVDEPLNAKRQLAEILLDRPLDDWVAERRTPHGWKSWDRMALELRVVTEGRVVIAGNTLRRWFSGGIQDDGRSAA